MAKKKGKKKAKQDEDVVEFPIKGWRSSSFHTHGGRPIQVARVGKKILIYNLIPGKLLKLSVKQFETLMERIKRGEFDEYQ